jgi:hypothetical protein
MIQVVNPHRVQSRIKQHGQFAGRRRITIQDGLNVFSYRSQHVPASQATLLE